MPRQSKPRHPPEPAAHFTRNRVVVIGVSVGVMVVAALLAWLAMTSLPKSTDSAPMLPIRHVTFVGDIERIDVAELNRVAGGIKGGMLQTNLNDVKAAVKQVRWVRNADVRRRFPSTLEVSVEEHRPFAKWQVGDAEQKLLVNTIGEVFEGDLDTVVPIFSGPQGTAKEVLATFATFKSQLVAIGREPVSIALSARRAWQIKLDDGASLELGRVEAGERLDRYVNSYPFVPALQVPNARIDMRYRSGMALKFAEAKPVARGASKPIKKPPVKT